MLRTAASRSAFSPIPTNLSTLSLFLSLISPLSTQDSLFSVFPPAFPPLIRLFLSPSLLLSFSLAFVEEIFYSCLFSISFSSFPRLSPNKTCVLRTHEKSLFLRIIPSFSSRLHLLLSSRSFRFFSPVSFPSSIASLLVSQKREERGFDSIKRQNPLATSMSVTRPIAIHIFAQYPRIRIHTPVFSYSCQFWLLRVHVYVSVFVYYVNSVVAQIFVDSNCGEKSFLSV